MSLGLWLVLGNGYSNGQQWVDSESFHKLDTVHILSCIAIVSCSEESLLFHQQSDKSVLSCIPVLQGEFRACMCLRPDISYEVACCLYNVKHSPQTLLEGGDSGSGCPHKLHSCLLCQDNLWPYIISVRVESGHARLYSLGCRHQGGLWGLKPPPPPQFGDLYNTAVPYNLASAHFIIYLSSLPTHFQNCVYAPDISRGQASPIP